MSKSSNVAVWTPQDWLDKACSHLDIGKPKPVEAPPAEVSEAAVQEVLSDLDEETMAAFKQAVIRHARRKHGSFDKFLEANPTFAQKCLLMMMKEPEKVPAMTLIKIDAPWITPDRLSYHHSPPPAAQIEDAVIKPEPWKEPTKP